MSWMIIDVLFGHSSAELLVLDPDLSACHCLSTSFSNVKTMKRTIDKQRSHLSSSVDLDLVEIFWIHNIAGRLKELQSRFG